MPFNPSDNPSTSGQQAGVQLSNPINDPGFNSRQGSNTFDLSASNLLTARFGEITPFFYFNAIGRDRIELKSNVDLRSYTLSSPLFSSLKMRKSYFSVPLKAIMPNTWNYLFVNPVKGNDVPANAYSFVDLLALVKALAQFAAGASSTGARNKPFADYLNCFFLIMQICSRGSLLDYLGCSYPIDAKLKEDGYLTMTCDEAFDSLCSYLARDEVSLSFQYDVFNPSTGSVDYTVGVDNSGKDGDLRSVVDVFYTLMQHPDFSPVGDVTFDDYNTIFDWCNDFFDALTNVTLPACNVNLYKLVAYHMAVAQFYTNDHVDSIYSADLWLSNQKALISSVRGYQTFSLNGVSLYYDVFSNMYLDYISANFNSTPDANRVNLIYFLSNLFGYAHSLRYGDYFNSARPQPLAVGDVSVPVTGSKVSVIDVNKNLHIQRFLNAVNRVGSNIVDYAKGIFGYKPDSLDPAPNFIATEYVNIFGDEIDNTSGTDTQGTVNTNLVANDSHFAFDVYIGEPSIVLGLLSFECVGSYPALIEKDNFHKTRYDMFNPFLQHIGDQTVNNLELCQFTDVSGNADSSFGYQVRYAEYKFKMNQQHGGFNTSLKSWSMPIELPNFISEDSIRNRPYEFDKFYKSLTGASLANYFHFQIKFTNSLRANRAMDFEPTLL